MTSIAKIGLSMRSARKTSFNSRFKQSRICHIANIAQGETISREDDLTGELFHGDLFDDLTSRLHNSTTPRLHDSNSTTPPLHLSTTHQPNNIPSQSLLQQNTKHNDSKPPLFGLLYSALSSNQKPYLNGITPKRFGTRFREASSPILLPAHSYLLMLRDKASPILTR